MDVDFLKYKYEDVLHGVVTRTSSKIGIRHVQGIYMTAACIVMGLMRGCNTAGITAMTDPGRRNDTDLEIYTWSRSIQGSMLSSFFFGYALTLLPAELFFRRISGKTTMLVIFGVNGILCILIPTILYEGGWIAICNVQFIMGMTQACISASNQSLLNVWFPPYEKKILTGWIYAGLQIGVAMSFPVSSAISSAVLGWKLVFYSMAMMMLSAVPIWGLLTAGSPKEHPAAGDKEKEFISDSLKGVKKKYLTVPWRDIVRSSPIWAVTCVHMSTNALFVLYLSEMPVYLKQVLNLSSSETGWFCMLCFMSFWLVYVTLAPTMEWMSNTGFINYILTITQFRKIVNTIGACAVVLGLTLLSYLDVQRTLQLALVCGSFAFSAVQYCGFLENLKDISDNYHGTLMTCTCVVGSLVGATVPFINGLILNDDTSDPNRWRSTFKLVASFYLACNIVYLVLGRAERQYWDFDCQTQKAKFGNVNALNTMELDDIEENKNEKSDVRIID